MGGSVSRYPDGQPTMRAIDNGAGHACSDDMKLSRCFFVLIVFLSLGTSHDTINNKIVMPSGFISFYSLRLLSIIVA